MDCSTPRRRRFRAFPLIAALWIAAPAALAQEPADAPEGSGRAEVLVVPLEEVSASAETTVAELQALIPDEEARAELDEIRSGLTASDQEIEAQLAAARAAIGEKPNVRALRELETQLLALRIPLSDLDAQLDQRLGDLRRALDQVEARAAVWEATRVAAAAAETSQATLDRIAFVQREIQKVRAELTARRNEVLALRDRLVDPRTSLDTAIGDVRGATRRRLEGIFSLDRPPLWRAHARQLIRQDLSEDWWGPLRERLRRVSEYAQQRSELIGFQVALFVGLAVGLRALRARAQRRAAEHYDLRDAEKVFQLPTSMALVVALAFTPQLHPLAPLLFMRIAGLLAVVPSALIVRKLTPAAMFPLLLAIVCFFVIDRVRDLIEFMPAVQRGLFLAELSAALGFLLWLRRPSRLLSLPDELRGRPAFRAVGAAMQVATLLLGIALAADVVGLGDLGDLIGSATLRSGYVAVFVYAVLKALQGLVAYGLVMRPLRLLRLVSRHRSLVRHRLDQGMSALAMGVWAYATLAFFGLARPLRSGLAEALAAELTLGAVTISLGNVLVFFLTVWLSFVLARFVNFVLAEDFFPRVRLARGLPYAISSLLRYALIFFGLLVALAAAGIELTNLTIVAGGLGVGIGFGLQNVVNNFVSGLILLFERPFQVGDAVQLPNQNFWGEIRHIGIRASVIRLWDGAEVIVPNGQLISDAVTNWTLSDRRRRVEVSVGVEYGTDAERVLALLLEVARSNPEVLDDPEPRALFLNFGDSALEFVLRVWISEFSEGLRIRSDLAVALQRALKQAGIGVPFPQRDLHLRTVTPGAASELRSAGLVPGSAPATSDSGNEG